MEPEAARPIPQMSGQPKLAQHVRLRFDAARNQHVLLSPETVAVLNKTSADILRLCDGRRSIAEIVTELQGSYDRVADTQVRSFLARLAAKRYLEITDG
ncbi:MAG TPA: pyrroloquinoline quinone biosynthesis peptide chaperone PqqD [Pseudonocardiaceae bacterium]|nr:pyrroloquinoline quinone biosynthesis peptide chaperone PqqD [Pseudonocardiaceae bacterium]